MFMFICIYVHTLDILCTFLFLAQHFLNAYTILWLYILYMCIYIFLCHFALAFIQIHINYTIINTTALFFVFILICYLYEFCMSFEPDRSKCSEKTVNLAEKSQKDRNCHESQVQSTLVTCIPNFCIICVHQCVNR